MTVNITRFTKRDLLKLKIIYYSIDDKDEMSTIISTYGYETSSGKRNIVKRLQILSPNQIVECINMTIIESKSGFWVYQLKVIIVSSDLEDNVWRLISLYWDDVRLNLFQIWNKLLCKM